MMNNLSDHTRVVNLLIGLSKEVPGCPSILSDTGYRLDVIEPKFTTSEGDQVNPDLLISSNSSLNVLVTECKGGHISEERIQKYERISAGDLHYEVEEIHDPSQIDHELMFSGTSKTEESFDYLTLPHPGIIFDFENNEIRKLNSFSDSELDEALDTLQMPEYPPTSFYPFSPDDDDAVIAAKICQEIISRGSNAQNGSFDFGARDLLDSIHPHWEKISRSEQSTLVSRVESIIGNLLEEGLDTHVDQLDDESYYVRSAQAFQRKAHEVMDEIGTQTTYHEFLDLEDE